MSTFINLRNNIRVYLFFFLYYILMELIDFIDYITDLFRQIIDFYVFIYLCVFDKIFRIM